MNINFNSAYDKYIAYLSLRLKPTTLLGIKRKFEKHILPFFNKSIYQINDDDYLKWQNYIISLDYSNSFNSHMYTTIKGIFDYLQRFYNITNLPVKYGKYINYKIDNSNSVGTTWNIKQFRKFIKKVDDKVYHALFNILYFAGLRKGEALALTFNDIDKNYIKVRSTITKEYFNGKRLIMTPKSKKSIRKIRIDFKLRIELKHLRKYYTKKYGYFNTNFFVLGGISPLATTTVDRKKDKYCKLAHLEPIRIHDFRHSYATMLYNKNVKLKVIQSLLGHSSIETTANIYVHNDEKEEKRVLRVLNLLRLHF